MISQHMASWVQELLLLSFLPSFLSLPLSFFQLYPWHVKISRPGMEPGAQYQSKPQQWRCHILNPLSHQGTPRTAALENITGQALGPCQRWAAAEDACGQGLHRESRHQEGKPRPCATGVPRPEQDKEPEQCRAGPGSCWPRECGSVCVCGRICWNLPNEAPKGCIPQPPIPNPPVGTGRGFWGLRAGSGNLKTLRIWVYTARGGAHLWATQPVDPEYVPWPEKGRQGATHGLRNCWVKDLIRRA